MKYFSTFSGIGGFELGIQQAYESIKSKELQRKELFFHDFGENLRVDLL